MPGSPGACVCRLLPFSTAHTHPAGWCHTNQAALLLLAGPASHGTYQLELVGAPSRRSWCFAAALQGRDGAAALFDNLKVGSVVGLRGRPQQHPQQPGLAADSNGQHQHVLDVVVQAARVLHKSR
jgi:hypothetical protein